MRMTTVVLAVLLSGQALADTADLTDILNAASSADPEWAAAQRSLDADQQLASQGRAALLPSLTASYGLTRSYRDPDGAVGETRSTSDIAALTLVQPLFRPDAWYSKNQGKALSNAGEARFEQARQDFLLRVTQRYLDVLRRWEDLHTAQAEERALSRQLEQTQERFDVGLVPITDVEEAKAAYDLSRAGLILAQADFDISRDQLEAMTDKTWQKLAGLREDLPMSGPEPAQPSHWMERARSNNPQVLASRYEADSAKAAARQRTSAQLPSVNLVGRYEVVGYSNVDGPVVAGQLSDYDGKSIGIEASMPLFAGGGLNSQRKEASYRYQAAEEVYRLVWRDVGQSAQSLARQVQASALNVAARKQALRSAESALRATESGYEVGTRNVVDVLTAQRNLYANQRDYSAARYDYIVASLQLQATAGDLTTDDIELINGWLSTEINVDLTE
ncbi:MAG: TolC family outer membrane protein [Alcanivoracaceae bacterium]|nr:TolC family outer membrane protein [Alcanivoracaceae bacterium]